MKKMPFGEADFLIRVLTKDFGKIDVLAKGARKIGSKLNFHLDILNFIRVSWVKNGERLSTLLDAEVISRFDDWFSDADKISVAGRILKVLDMVILHGAEDKKLFFLVVGFFKNDEEVRLRPNLAEVGLPNLELERRAADFLKQIFEHEGYGNSLPEEHKANIIKLWPILTN